MNWANIDGYFPVLTTASPLKATELVSLYLWNKTIWYLLRWEYLWVRVYLLEKGQRMSSFGVCFDAFCTDDYSETIELKQHIGDSVPDKGRYCKFIVWNSQTKDLNVDCMSRPFDFFIVLNWLQSPLGKFQHDIYIHPRTGRWIADDRLVDDSINIFPDSTIWQ